MSILVGRDTKLLVQGITGREGSFHALRCREYGANLVAGVTPGRGGQMFEDDIPVYNSIRQAVDETGANASLIFVPPAFAADAIVEYLFGGIDVVACISDGIPFMYTIRVVLYLKGKYTTIIGPNCPC
ncbi:MAG: succinate--CoA ligase subunit alpha, partial [SAR202 cluster bacterium]|nr:succinate--CoA ligase subunit alpha [SAR202 cluster bacterium]